MGPRGRRRTGGRILPLTDAGDLASNLLPCQALTATVIIINRFTTLSLMQILLLFGADRV